MKIAHHPDSTTLVTYAAGSLDEAFVTVVATHLTSCAACRARLREIEEIGGTLLESVDTVALNATALERAMSRLEQTSEQHFQKVEGEPEQSEPSLPDPLARLVTGGLDSIAWKTVAPGVAMHRLPISKAALGSLTLLKIAPGKKIPEHGHGGTELTLVLAGSYRDAFGRFGPGDVADLDEYVEHQPVVDSSEPCICLVATEAQARFKSFFGRLFQAAAYGPAKAALINLAESLRPELAAQGVTLSIVNPGFVDTPMTASNDFPMPFLMPADVAARRLLSGLENKDYEIVFPRRLAWGMKALRLIPNALFFWIVRTFILKS